MNNFKHNDYKYIKRNCNVDVKETVKVANITDPFENLRYKVALISYDVIDDGKYIPHYRIKVINYFGPQEPLIIVQRPEFDEDEITNYNEAIKIYDYYVKSYTNLVKAETKDHQCIDIYKDNVGYKPTEPRCCATCKWSRKRVVQKDFIYEVSGKLECANPANCKKYQMNMGEPHNVHRHNYDYMHGHMHRCDDFAHDIIYPTIDPFGICDYYVKVTKQQVPVPGQSITDFIDIRIGSRLDDRIEKIANDVVKEQLDGEISSTISSAIENLDTEINNAVNEAFEKIDIDAEINDAVNNALSSSDLSNSIKESVSEIINSDEIENKIADIVEDNMTIGSITGNKGIKKFTDTNNNGMQDSNEPDEPDTEEMIILGDMGA